MCTYLAIRLNAHCPYFFSLALAKVVNALGASLHSHVTFYCRNGCRDAATSSISSSSSHACRGIVAPYVPFSSDIYEANALDSMLGLALYTPLGLTALPLRCVASRSYHRYRTHATSHRSSFQGTCTSGSDTAETHPRNWRRSLSLV